MTHQLVPAVTDDQCLTSVNARGLHAALGVGRVFSSWILERIRQYGFVEGEDFVTVQNLSSPDPVSSKARPQRMVDYRITLDMVENNDEAPAIMTCVSGPTDLRQ